jgi:hypothetical protein
MRTELASGVVLVGPEVLPGAWPTANASTALAADRTSAGITVSRLVTRIIGLRRQRERWCNPAVRITSDRRRRHPRTAVHRRRHPWRGLDARRGFRPRPLVLIGHGGGPRRVDRGDREAAGGDIREGPGQHAGFLLVLSQGAAM